MKIKRKYTLPICPNCQMRHPNFMTCERHVERLLAQGFTREQLGLDEQPIVSTEEAPVRQPIRFVNREGEWGDRLQSVQRIGQNRFVRAKEQA